MLNICRNCISSIFYFIFSLFVYYLKMGKNIQFYENQKEKEGKKTHIISLINTVVLVSEQNAHYMIPDNVIPQCPV